MKNRCINLYRYLTLCAILSFISHDAVAMRRQDTRPLYKQAGFTSQKAYEDYRWDWQRQQSLFIREKLAEIDPVFIGMTDPQIRMLLEFLAKRGCPITDDLDAKVGSR